MIEFLVMRLGTILLVVVLGSVALGIGCILYMLRTVFLAELQNEWRRP